MVRGAFVPAGISPEVAFGIVEAFCLERRKIRVRFNGAPKARSLNESDDALNPNNWELQSRPDMQIPGANLSYMTPEVVGASVVRGEPLFIDVLLDDDLSFDTFYQITLSPDVQRGDDIGGWSLDGVKTAIFAGFDPSCRTKPVPDVFGWFGRAARKYDLKGDAEKYVSLYQDLLEQMKSLIDCYPEQFDPLYCREDFLDSRMYSLGNPFEFITSEMSVIEKRKLALELVNIYRQKGTVAGVQNALTRVLGRSDLQLFFWNLAQWKIGRDHKEHELNYTPETDPVFIGHAYFDPGPNAPTNYPTHPITQPYLPEFYPFTGTCFVGADPSYTETGIGADDRITEDRFHPARVGEFQVGKDPDVLLGNPQGVLEGIDVTEDESSLGFKEETGRKFLYSYMIFIPENLDLSELEKTRIIALAEYMQPAHLRLQGLFQKDVQYTPGTIGLSQVGVDFVIGKD